MDNKKLPINNNFLAALLFMIGLFNDWAAVAMAIVVLMFVSDEWLKKMMIRLLAIVFVFGILSAFDVLFLEVIDLIRLAVPVSYTVTTIVDSTIRIAEFLCMLLMAVHAYKGRVFNIRFLEKIVEKVCQRESDNSKVSYCIKCGSLINEEDSFCQKCGTKKS